MEFTNKEERYIFKYLASYLLQGLTRYRAADAELTVESIRQTLFGITHEIVVEATSDSRVKNVPYQQNIIALSNFNGVKDYLESSYITQQFYRLTKTFGLSDTPEVHRYRGNSVSEALHLCESEGFIEGMEVIQFENTGVNGTAERAVLVFRLVESRFKKAFNGCKGSKPDLVDREGSRKEITGQRDYHTEDSVIDDINTTTVAHIIYSPEDYLFEDGTIEVKDVLSYAASSETPKQSANKARMRASKVLNSNPELYYGMIFGRDMSYCVGQDIKQYHNSFENCTMKWSTTQEDCGERAETLLGTLSRNVSRLNAMHEQVSFLQAEFVKRGGHKGFQKSMVEELINLVSANIVEYLSHDETDLRELAEMVARM